MEFIKKCSIHSHNIISESRRNMNQNKLYKLPINMHPSVKSECWTFYKLSIIEALSYDCMAPWMASHLELFFDKEFNAYFGDQFSPYALEYFSGLLDFKEIDMRSVPAEGCIEYIINEVKNNHYIMTFLPHTKLMIHEVLIRGVDINSKIIYIICFTSGKFQEIPLPFDVFLSEYRKTYDYFSRNAGAKMNYLYVSFPLMRISVKKDINLDICLIGFFNKLTNEINGQILNVEACDENGQVASGYKYYNGLACLLGMEYRLYEYVRDKQFIVGNILAHLSQKLNLSLLKFYEHRKILYNSLVWYEQIIGRQNAEMREYITQYKNCCLEMEKIYCMAYKFSLTGDWNLFDRIRAMLKNRYAKEKKILTHIYDMASELYWKNSKRT